MGWDSNRHNLLTLPINEADLSIATNVGPIDQGDGTPRFNRGYMFANSKCNPMAKYKSFKNAAPGFADAAAYNTARQNARYGLAMPAAFSPLSGELPGMWTHDKPTQGAPNEWFRDADFDGYAPGAVPPIAMTVYDLAVKNTFGVIFWKDSYVNNYYSQKGSYARWVANQSLSIQEILGSVSPSYYDYNIAIAIYDITDGGVNLVILNKKFGDIQSLFFQMLCPQGDGNGGDYVDSGIHYPIIPILNDINRDGNEFRLVMCLTSWQGTTPSEYAYIIAQNNPACYSLAFSNGRPDQVIAEANASVSIRLLTGTINSGPTLVKDTSYTDPSGVWERYQLSGNITAGIVVASGWTGATVGVRTGITAQSGLFGDATGPGVTGQLHVDTSHQLPAGAGTYTKTITEVADVGYVYFPITAYQSQKFIMVSAAFRQNENTKEFTNVLTVNS